MSEETERRKNNESTASTAADYRPCLSDFALFLSVMKVKEAYRSVLSIILEEPGLEFKEIKVQQVILNHTGRRSIRLDAWAQDERGRQFDMEMQNDSDTDDIRKRSRFYQSLIDSPILKAGKKTRYRNLPATAVIFITQDDLFGKDRAMYTFSEWCSEVPGLPLEDGSCKIFLNMTSKNGRPELVSLLQYMKNTTMDDDNITLRDQRLLDLDRIVREVLESEEWEDAKMGILEIGMERGKELGMKLGMSQGLEQGLAQGLEQGRFATLVRLVDTFMKNYGLDLQKACEGLEISPEEYEKARYQIGIQQKVQK